MKKNVMFISLGCTLGLAVGGAILAFNNVAQGREIFFEASADPYTLILNASNVNPDGEGNFTVYTSQGNAIQFESSGLTVAGGKLNLAADGYIRNPYQVAGDHNRISGLTQISNVCDSGSLKVDYTWGESLAAVSPYYQRRNYVIHEEDAYGFLDEKPNYVNIKTSEATVLTSLTLKYDCTPGFERGDNLQIGTASMLERLKTVVNWGNNFEGQVVELSADIDMDTLGKTMSPIGSNDAHCFSGTFDGKNHSISNLSLSGTEKIGLFGVLSYGTVKNLIIADANIEATSQHAGIVCGKAVCATIENVSTSGALSGPKQSGGLVGVNVLGTGKTTIEHCINTATITGGSTGGGMGGLVGFNHSGKLYLFDCTNNGNVTSTTNQTTGGLVGATATSDGVSVEIHLCEVGKDVVVSSNGSEATSPRAKNGILIGSSDITKVTVIGSGKVTDLINSVSEYDEFVSSCASNPYYQYKVAMLTADLDFEAAGHEVSTFYGLLNGNGHTISNLTNSGSSQIALFGNVYNGGVKNLKMSNVDITATTQRAAAIAGRSELASYYNIEVLSGTITGLKQSGGIVGAVVTNKTTIVDCINRANVVSTGDNSKDHIGCGGIAGIVTSTSANLEIDGCKNYGSISSSVPGGAGIVGYISSFNSTNVLSVKNSINYGNVTVSAAGKSGILGYIGTVSAATSVLIDNCENNGAISGSGEYTGGIFGGWAPTAAPADPSYILTMTIENTDNYGTVSGTGNGTGGIVGASNNVQNYLVIKILSCDNHGAISGAAYVGGIEGLIRNTSTTNESIVDGCNNYGNITSTGTGCGGIAGTARINIVNCGCYYDATLNANGTIKKASAAPEKGAPGYIALNYESGCPTHTGNRLINSDGSDYSA